MPDVPAIVFSSAGLIELEILRDGTGLPVAARCVGVDAALTEQVGEFRGRLVGDDGPFIVQGWREVLRRISDGGAVVYRVVEPAGGRQFEVTAHAPAGDRLVLAAVDVTERACSEAALTAKVEELDRYFLSALDLLCIADTEGSFVRVNREWERTLGYSIGDLEGRRFLEFVHPDDLPATMAAMSRLGSQETILDFVNRYRCKDGSYRWIEWRSSPHGSLIYAVARDITKRKQSEDALARQVTSLTQPLDDAADVSFEDLFDLADIQRLQDEFAAATGVATIITRPDGTPITRPGQFTRFCGDIVRKTTKGCANCHKSDSIVGRLCLDGPTIQTCLSGGLWDAGAGITVGGKHIANWLIGQVRDESQTEVGITAYAREIGADEIELITAFREVPSMSRERFGRIARMLFTLANQLSTVAYQNLQQARFITERRRAEELLRRNEEDLRVTLDSIGDAVIATDATGRITRMNPVAERLTGWPSAEATGRALPEVFRIINAQTRLPMDNPAERVLASGQVIGLANHTILVHRDGREFQIADSGAPIRSQSGSMIGVVLVFRDVTAEHALQEQVRQSQKMDAIGQLAGGVAHDFNNMLAGVLGGAELLRFRLAGDLQGERYLSMIVDSAQRAAGLTHKLLSFARRTTIDQAPVDVHHAVRETVAILRSTIDRRIRIETSLEAAPSWVVGDLAQLQSSFLNLGINASHAMPEGGTMRFSSRVVDLDAAACQAGQDLNPGPHVEIEVSDTGCGIPPAHLQRIFEPFFTTKAPGKGTGLGLSAALGMVQQHHGAITVRSQVGAGTSFRILLPVSATAGPAQASSVAEPVHGTGLILVVDDEPVMRTTCSEILERLGYRVLVAENGAAAVELFRTRASDVDLVILDMVMPVMNGRDCLSALRRIRPDIRALLASGFSREEDLSDLRRQGLAGFIQKPFRLVEFSQAVALALRNEDAQPRR